MPLNFKHLLILSFHFICVYFHLLCLLNVFYFQTKLRVIIFKFLFYQENWMWTSFYRCKNNLSVWNEISCNQIQYLWSNISQIISNHHVMDGLESIPQVPMPVPTFVCYDTDLQESLCGQQANQLWPSKLFI